MKGRRFLESLFSNILQYARFPKKVIFLQARAAGFFTEVSCF